MLHNKWLLRFDRSAIGDVTIGKAIRNIFFCLLILATTDAWVVDDEGCRTPNRGVGSCVPIKSCAPIIDFIRDSPRPISERASATIRAYQCGVLTSGEVKVCCPPGPIPLVDAVPFRVADTPPDVLAHRNLKLLPPVTACGPYPADDRILYGNRTALNEFPWMALLSYQTSKGPDFRCGGTIINERYILTAAHCITNLVDLTLLGVRVGEHDISSVKDCEKNFDGMTCAPPVQDLSIVEVVPHPLYNKPPYQHDIGLLRVDPPMNLSVVNAKPICLPLNPAERNYNFESSGKLTVTGWGATETGRKSSVLLKVEIPTTRHANCSAKYASQVELSHRQLCAGGKDQKDSCQGDSGGPLQKLTSIQNGKYAVFVQYGIVSFGPKFCGSEGSPGVYTKVAYYMDWIMNNLKP